MSRKLVFLSEMSSSIFQYHCRTTVLASKW